MMDRLARLLPHMGLKESGEFMTSLGRALQAQNRELADAILRCAEDKYRLAREEDGDE